LAVTQRVCRAATGCATSALGRDSALAHALGVASVTEPLRDSDAKPPTVTVFTIGHSTRSISDFVKLLTLNGVRHLIDVRSFPRSRRWPQFDHEPLAAVLEANGIRYSHLAELGGRRRRKAGRSPNAGWAEAGFRNYADYMQSGDFDRGIERLARDAGIERCAIMCSEALWWRCHRRLIADALLVRGLHVQHILDESAPKPAQLTPFAVVKGTSITYPPHV
jgi:uncharacterized protein (DUF488 family)